MCEGTACVVRFCHGRMMTWKLDYHPCWYRGTRFVRVLYYALSATIQEHTQSNPLLSLLCLGNLGRVWTRLWQNLLGMQQIFACTKESAPCVVFLMGWMTFITGMELTSASCCLPVWTVGRIWSASRRYPISCKQEPQTKLVGTPSSLFALLSPHTRAAFTTSALNDRPILVSS